MNREQRIEVSVSLQELAVVIDGFLAEKAGERISFVLVVATDDVGQYISNTKREDGVELIESLLARWKAKRADIPAHYNPDLPR